MNQDDEYAARGVEDSSGETGTSAADVETIGRLGTSEGREMTAVCSCKWKASMVQVEEPEYQEFVGGKEYAVYQTRPVEFYREIKHTLDPGCRAHAFLLRVEPGEAILKDSSVMPMQIDTRVRLVQEIGLQELLKVKMPGGVYKRVSLDYILQEWKRKGHVDLTGETSPLVKGWGED